MFLMSWGHDLIVGLSSAEVNLHDSDVFDSPQLVENAVGHRSVPHCRVSNTEIAITEAHLADFWQHGAFAFKKLRRNGGPVADAQQLQPSEVWQSN